MPAAPQFGTDTLRVVFPQWQGGNDPHYQFGAHLLSYLAPPTSGPVVTVPVAKPKPGKDLVLQGGVKGRKEVLELTDSATSLVRAYRPRRVVTLGGDCLVSLAPFAYLADVYKNQKFGILWIDAHPDVTTPKDWAHAHTYVLATLLGVSDKDFRARVPTTVPMSRVYLGGLTEPLTKAEEAFFKEYPLMRCGPNAIKQGGQDILRWIKAVGLTHVAIHFDLDALSPDTFRSCLFAKPGTTPQSFAGIAKGELELQHVTALLNTVSQATNVVGLTIAEHFPWEAMQFRDALAKMPILKDSKL